MPSTLNQPRLARRDGRPAFLSQVALPRSVQTMEQARPLFDGVKQWLISQELRELEDLHISLSLKDDLGGDAGQSIGGIGRRHRVLIHKGFPAILCTGTMAHELMHAWIRYVHRPFTAPSWQREGLCELVRYEFYKAAQTRYSGAYMNIVQKRMPRSYRESYRRQRKHFAGQSLREIAQYIRRTGRLT